MLFKLKMNGKAELAQLDNILEKLNLDESQFLDMCVVAGCDYLANIKTIGIHTARGIIANKSFLEELVNHKNAPANYHSQFCQALMVFKHQMIYDIDEQSVKPLHSWAAGEDRDKYGPACGQYP